MTLDGVRSDEAHTTANSLSTALNHGAYTANSITSYISSSGNTAGQHAHGSILYVIRDEARHIFDISIMHDSDCKVTERKFRDEEIKEQRESTNQQITVIERGNE